MAGELNSILTALKSAPQRPSDLSRLCQSRKAVITSIYRLRNRGHEIVLIPAGNRKNEGTYHLTKLAGDLRPWSYPE